MLKFFTGAPTVQSVYETFTTDLKKVIAQQKTNLELAEQDHAELTTKLKNAEERQVKAKAEVELAESAIVNISNLLGIGDVPPAGGQ